MSDEMMRLARREKGCRRCPLREGCTQVVPGDGPTPCPTMFVGEATGFDEDQQGKPFVGVSGRLLDKMLHSAGMPRQTVYVSNAVRCRPPRNRQPNPSEISACKAWLWEEIKLVKPTVIVTLGMTPARLLVRPHFAYMKNVVGRAFKAPYLGDRGAIVPIYHPSYLLRGNMKLVEDMVRVLVRVRNYVGKTPREC